MINKEYSVFAAFMFINIFFALNCFTLIVSSVRPDFPCRDNCESIYTITKTDKTLFGYSIKQPVPFLRAIWDKKLIQVIFLISPTYHFCIDILENKNKYQYQDIKKCNALKSNESISFYKVNKRLSDKIVKEFSNGMEELILNSHYKDNIVILLQDQSYLMIDLAEISFTKNDGRVINAEDIAIRDYLDNRRRTITRIKVNSMLVINLDSTSESYISFLHKDKENRIISIQWEEEEKRYKKESNTLKYIIYTLLLPIAIYLDWNLFLQF